MPRFQGWMSIASVVTLARHSMRFRETFQLMFTPNSLAKLKFTAERRRWVMPPCPKRWYTTPISGYLLLMLLSVVAHWASVQWKPGTELGPTVLVLKYVVLIGIAEVITGMTGIVIIFYIIMTPCPCRNWPDANAYVNFYFIMYTYRRGIGYYMYYN